MKANHIITLEAPDKKVTVDFLENGHSISIEIELDRETQKLRIVTKVCEDEASQWSQDEHEVSVAV